MSYLKNLLIFLAGAAFFNAVEHILLPSYIDLPLVTKGFTLTYTLNLWAIISSAAVSVVLLWLSSRIDR